MSDKKTAEQELADWHAGLVEWTEISDAAKKLEVESDSFKNYLTQLYREQS